MPESMHAIEVLDDDARTLAWREVERPEPGPGQVRIRVAATAVNRADLLQRRGRYPVPKGASPILGLEAAGAIEAVGDGVDGWTVGDPVCVLLEGGGYAEYVVVDASMLLPVPDGLSMVEAAAIPEVFATAWLNVWMEGALQPGETVLVHAAASGVGTAAVQLCRAFGHRCFGTASGPKLPLVADLGAEVTIDRTHSDFVDAVKTATDGRGVDVILDPVGGAYLDRNVRALAHRGRLVIIGLLGGATGELPIARLLMKRQRVIGSVLRSRARGEKVEIMAELRSHVWPRFADGSLSPVIHDAMPITAAADAHGLLERNETVGKVVLTVPA